MHSPSGEQFEIAFEDQRAVVVEVGGGIREYSVDGRQVLDGYDLEEMCSSGRGQVLMPWPNRIAGGRYEFDGREEQLPIDEPSTTSAIHGLVRWNTWAAVERTAQSVVVENRLHPQPGYPFALELRIEYALSNAGLRVSTTASNVGSGPCPFGAGAHPYLWPGAARVDDALLRLPARHVLEVDERGKPVESAVDGTDFDFRQPRALGQTKLDTCFSGLERDGDGLARVVLASPDDASATTLWVDDAYGYLMLYTGDNRPDVDRRSLAIEPMTCPPQAFRSGEGVVVLEPAGSFTARWGLTRA